MRQPGDRVALARSGRVLDQVAATGALVAGGGLKAPHGIPLVVAGENDGAVPYLGGGRRTLGGRLDMDEAAEDVKPRVAAPDLLPEVTGAVTGRVRRVAPAAGVTAVERQKPRLLAGETGRHLHVVGIDSEVDERPSAKGHVGRIAVGPILVLRVLDGLMGERVLEFSRRDRDAVHEQTQVERLRRCGVIRQLAGHRKPVG